MEDDELKFIKLMIGILFLSGLLIGLAIGHSKETDCPVSTEIFISAYSSPILVKEVVTAVVTAYNTVPEQTWGDPCISASGDNICGMSNVVACPRAIPLGTWIIIDEEYYICLDRMNIRYGYYNFDISFDKDIKGAKEFGKQLKEIKIIR